MMSDTVDVGSVSENPTLCYKLIDGDALIPDTNEIVSDEEGSSKA